MRDARDRIAQAALGGPVADAPSIRAAPPINKGLIRCVFSSSTEELLSKIFQVMILPASPPVFLWYGNRWALVASARMWVITSSGNVNDIHFSLGVRTDREPLFCGGRLKKGAVRAYYRLLYHTPVLYRHMVAGRVSSNPKPKRPFRQHA
ncbi:hypothetical protein Vretifemale_5760 [Volvox reticuliferus]|uniref:Uncharacterized protein n=1 Tax=Volvox reticuliferus TaxID=1737510 RepID=A0A8J4C5V5_9CHLO|nr:hypothetical protein Vretifemale_5760 [Volvox reticuliferus]